MSAFLTKIILTTIAAMLASYLLHGVQIANITTALMVSVVLALLDAFVKPILIILTLPITIVTLGLFLLVINILIIKWAADIVPGFKVSSWWSALLFSLIVSVVNSLLESLLTDPKKK